MTTTLFAVAVLGIPLAFGAPLVRRHSLRGLSLAARVGVAWAGGTLVLTVLLTLLAAVGLRWAPWPIFALALIAALAAVRTQGPPGTRIASTEIPRHRGTTVAALCAAVAAAAGSLQFGAGAATSADLAYFWGVKAVHFALDRGMGFEWMQLPHLAHLHPNYPPLWPVSLAWGALISGSMPWPLVPVLSWFYLIAGGLIVHSLLQRRLAPNRAMVVGCLWFAVLTGATVRSFSGGNAEGPLLLFVTVAVTVLAGEERDGEPELRWLAAGALAGAVLTKSEGAVAAVLVVTGTAIRDRVWRRPKAIGAAARLAAPAVAAAGLWVAIRLAHGLPLADPVRESVLQLQFDHLEVILKVCTRLLGDGVSWIGWFAPLIAVSATRPLRPLRILPGLAVAGGLPAFAVFYYLHAVGNPVELIVWTFPRLVQPALSAWIVCLGILCFGAPGAPPPHRTTGAAGSAASLPARES